MRGVWTDKDLAEAARRGRLAKLRKLYIGGTQVGDAGLECIAAALQECRIL